MNHENHNQKVFEREYKHIGYNPIRPIEYSEHTTTILGDSAVTSNTIGKDNGTVYFCYDAHKDRE